MKKIEKGIVFSNDIKRILSGINAFDYKYEAIPTDITINNIRKDFKDDVGKIFRGNVTFISEEEMLEVNNLICGGYPHCYSR